VRSGHLKPLQKITATSVDIRHFVAGALKGFGFGKRNQTGELPPPPPPSAPLALTPFFCCVLGREGLLQLQIAK